MKRKMYIILVACIMLTMIPTKAFAYTTIGRRWSDNVVTYYYMTYGSTFSYGANAWSGLDAQFTYGQRTMM